MDRFSRLVDKIGGISSVIAIFFMLGISILVVINIILRGFFNMAMLGTYEAVELGMVVVGSLGIGYCAVKQGHISVDIFFKYLPRRVRVIIDICTNILGIGIWAAVAWMGVEYAQIQWANEEKTAIMHWPIPPMRYVFVLGVIILVLALVVDLRNLFRELKKK